MNPPALPCRPSLIYLPIGENSPAMQDLDILAAPLADWPRVPEREAIAAMMAAKGRIQEREPRCLDDVVAKLMTVTVTGGNCLSPETVALITRSVAFLTHQAPHLRRPGLERLVLFYARMQG